MKLRNVLLVFSILVVGSAVAYADPIGPDCASCAGSVYTLNNLGAIGASNGNTIYQVELIINPTTYNGSGTLIDAVAVKISSSAVDGVLAGAPGGVGAWAVSVNTNVNANGCEGGGGGFVCAESIGAGLTVPFNGSYAWLFNITVPGSALLSGSFESSVKALYVNVAGQQSGITSENITLQPGGGPGPTPVPEPSTLLLLGSGVMGLAGLRFLRK